MTYKSKILDSINSEFYGEEVKLIASNIFDYLKEGGANLSHISFGHLKNRAGEGMDDEDIIIAAKLLTLIDTPILREQYELVIEEYSKLITREELNEAKQYGFFVHPETGKEIENYPKYIVVYYVPSEYFLRNIAGHGG